MAAYKPSPYNSPLLDFEPLDMSLMVADDTPFPGGLASPPLSPSGIARPPTPGGGPLSSHPATPVNGGSYFPPPPVEKPATPPRSDHKSDYKSSTDSSHKSSYRPRVDSAVTRTPLSPASANSQFTPPQPQPHPSISKHRRRDSSGVRKLLSLTSLRNSLSGGSRSSLSLQRTPTISAPEQLYTADVFGTNNPRRRPSLSSHSIMSSFMTTDTSASPSPTYTSTTTTNNNPHTSYQAQVQGGRSPPQPQLRKRKSVGWFRRKSGLFMLDDAMDNDSHVTATAQENVRPSPEAQALQFGRSGSVVRSPYSAVSPQVYDDENFARRSPSPSSSPPPTLPNVASLKGGRLTGGRFAGEDVFASIGR